MKPFRKNLAIAIDGGGIRGVVVTRALTILEEELGRPLHESARLYAGTSTGSIISAALAAGMTASKIHDLYLELGHTVFRRSWRKLLFPVSRYRYPQQPLQAVLQDTLGNLKMKDLWADLRLTDLVITSFDVLKNKTLFIKPWKLQYQDWLLSHAVLASSCVPTYFPTVDGRAADIAIGATAGNICTITAPKAQYTKITEGARDGIAIFNIDGKFNGNAGNDELVLAFT